MYILLINIIPNHMCIFLPIIKIIVNYTLRITNRYCIQINEKQPLIRGAVYIKPLHFMRVLHCRSHAIPSRIVCIRLYYFICDFGATVLAMIAFAISRLTGRSKYIAWF